MWTHWFINEEKTCTRFDNVRSPGYAKCINWLRDMWIDFPKHAIVNSFSSCGIIDQIDLHSALREVLRTNTMFTDYVDDVNEADHIDGFEDSNDIFEDNREHPYTNSQQYTQSHYYQQSPQYFNLQSFNHPQSSQWHTQQILNYPRSNKFYNLNFNNPESSQQNHQIHQNHQINTNPPK